MLPHEKTLVERLKDKPFALIGVNSDDPEKSDPQYAKKRPERDAAFKAQRKSVDQQFVPGADEAAFIKRASTAARTMLDEQGIAWRNAIDGSTSGPWASRWNTHSWPTIYLIDAKGVIRHVNPPREAPELDELIEKLIAEAQSASKE
jgi:hypothetical protein